MNSSVDELIGRLRTVVQAKNDSDLARKLGVDQSTVSSWRSRGRVPKKFVDFANDDMNSLPEKQPLVWNELKEHAQAIALLRFVLVRSEIAASGNVDRTMVTFIDTTPFLLITYRVVRDLREKMDATKVDIKTAQALILQNDLLDPSKTRQRVEDQLAEDIADNPRLNVAS